MSIYKCVKVNPKTSLRVKSFKGNRLFTMELELEINIMSGIGGIIND